MTQFARQLLAGLGTGVGVGLLSGILTGGIISILMMASFSGMDQVALIREAPPAQRAACDRAVVTLLSTDSLVELERSKYLIERLNCSVSRRLPE